MPAPSHGDFSLVVVFLQHIGCFTLGTGGYCRKCSNAAVSAFVANGVFTSTALFRGVSVFHTS